MKVRFFPLPGALALAFAPCAATSQSSQVLVQVTDIKSAEGEIGCALFNTEKGFPIDSLDAKVIWQPANPNGVTCEFTALEPGSYTALEPGSYAVSVSNDLNGNLRTDTKMFGIPTEDWGVSNNVRPRMRAPGFREAAFQLAGNQDLAIEVKVGR
jgi:uncharacterized protein (DUF2141 family)